MDEENYEYIIDLCASKPPSPEDQGEGTITASDSDEAAELACERSDLGGDYDVANNEGATVYVRKVGELKWNTITVCTETSVSYTAYHKLEK